MKYTNLFSLSFILISCVSISTLTASGQQEAKDSSQTVQQDSIEGIVSSILSEYSSDSLTLDDTRAIHEAFRAQGLRGGPELDEIIASLGFDPDLLRKTPPPPVLNGNNSDEKPLKENQHHQGNNEPVKIYESLISDLSIPGFNLESSAVKEGFLLDEFKCETKVDGIETSIPLSWDGVPEGTKSLAIVMYHYPNPDDKTGVNSYLLLWGIDPSIKRISYGMALSDEWYMGQNKDGNAVSYTSPCSPSIGHHEYVISIFALSEYPEALPRKSSIDVDFTDFMDAIESVEIIGKAELKFKA